MATAAAACPAVAFLATCSLHVIQLSSSSADPAYVAGTHVIYSTWVGSRHCSKGGSITACNPALPPHSLRPLSCACA